MTVTETGTEKAEIDFSKCVGCGACIRHCPVSAIKMIPGWKAKVDTSVYIGCGKCVRLCHKHAPRFIRKIA